MFELTPFVHRSNNMTTYNPFREMEDFEKHFFGNMSDLFHTDIKDNGKEYLVETDMPGFKKEDIHVDIEGDTLTVSAERHSEYENKEQKDAYLCKERSFGSYSRSFDVSQVKTGEIAAAYEDGVLKLTLPKKEETTPASRRLEIR